MKGADSFQRKDGGETEDSRRAQGRVFHEVPLPRLEKNSADER